MPQPPTDLTSFTALMDVVKCLRGPDGCPWDKEQSHETLTQYAIEEAHELAEAIESGDKQGMIHELGDLLLQVALHSEIGRQSGDFTIDDVVSAVNEKMIRRHPHVFGDVKVKDSQEVLSNWAKIKKAEKIKDATGAPSERSETPNGDAAVTSFDIPTGLPSLQRAQKIGDKTGKYAFDWKSPNEVLSKLHEELDEFREALGQNNADHLANELGDVLFTLAQLARHLGLNSEQALRRSNQKFERRFFKMLELKQIGLDDFAKLDSHEKERLWHLAKQSLAKKEESTHTT